MENLNFRISLYAYKDGYRKPKISQRYSSKARKCHQKSNKQTQQITQRCRNFRAEHDAMGMNLIKFAAHIHNNRVKLSVGRVYARANSTVKIYYVQHEMARKEIYFEHFSCENHTF